MLTRNHSLFVCGYNITGVPTKYNPMDSVLDEGPERRWTLSDVSDVTQKKSVSSAIATVEKIIRIKKRSIPAKCCFIISFFLCDNGINGSLNEFSAHPQSA